MKLINQSVPPELAADYAKIVSTNTALVGGIAVARQRKAVNATKKRVRKNKFLSECWAAAEQLAAYLTSKDGINREGYWIANEAKEIYAGVYNPEYWEVIPITSNTVLAESPGFEAFTGPRNYAYPDPLNQPTKAIYTSGTGATGNPSYSGSTVDGYYRDTLLKWWRAQFNMSRVINKADDEPLFLSITSDISASASFRPSKAMISYIWQAYLCNDVNAVLTSADAPMVKPRIQYWRYITPRGEPPYFALIKAVKGLFSIKSNKHWLDSVDVNRLVVRLAPCPMLGKRYNNNTTVSTELTNVSIQLVMIKKAVEFFWEWYTVGSGVDFLNNGLTVLMYATTGIPLFRANKFVNSGLFTWQVTIEDIDTENFDRVKLGICRSLDEVPTRTDKIYLDYGGSEIIYEISGEPFVIAFGVNYSLGDTIKFELDFENGWCRYWINDALAGFLSTYCLDPDTSEEIPISGNWAPFMSYYRDAAVGNIQTTSSFNI